MDSRRMLVFREVARAGSLAGAARALGWTQPAVSQQVRALERETGTALVLTGLAAGVVRLAAFPTAAAVLLPPALVTLRERAPALQVHFAEQEPPEAEAAVRSGEADLALVFRHEDDEDAVPGDLLREPLGGHPVHAVVPAGRPVPATLADLRDEPWIAGCVRCRGHLLRCARRAGFTPDVRFATDDHVVVQRLVGRGLGVALLPSWALAASTQPGVVAVDLPDVDGRVVETLARPDARRVPGVAALLAALRAAA